MARWVEGEIERGISQRTPTTPSPKKKAIGKRRRRVDALLRKRGRDGNPVISSARDMQCALEDGVEVDHTTVTRDIVATGAHQSHKKTILGEKKNDGDKVAGLDLNPTK